MNKLEYRVAHALVRADGKLDYQVFPEGFESKVAARLWIEREGRAGDPAICIVKLKVVWRPSEADIVRD